MEKVLIVVFHCVTQLHFPLLCSAFPINVWLRDLNNDVEEFYLLNWCMTNHSWITINENFQQWKLSFSGTRKFYVHFAYDVNIHSAVYSDFVNFNQTENCFWIIGNMKAKTEVSVSTSKRVWSLHEIKTESERENCNHQWPISRYRLLPASFYFL